MRFVPPVASVDKGKGMNYVDSKRKTLSILIGAFKRIITYKPRKWLYHSLTYRATDPRPSVCMKDIQFK